MATDEKWRIMVRAVWASTRRLGNTILDFERTMTTINLRRKGLLGLVRDFLEHADLTQSMVALEREAGLASDGYPAELLFFQDLILEGEWSEVVNLVQLLAHSESYSDVMYAIERQRFLELLHIQRDPPTASCPTPENREIQEQLQRLEQLCPSRTEFATLSCLITLPNLTDHPTFSDWEVKASRCKLFQCVGRKMAEAIYHSAVDGIFPLRTSCDLASDHLVQLVAKGLLYEQCEATVAEHLAGVDPHSQPLGIVDLQKCISSVLAKSRHHELISQPVSIEVEDREQPVTEDNNILVSRRSYVLGASRKPSPSLAGYTEHVPPANGRWHTGSAFTQSGGQSTTPVPRTLLTPELSNAHGVEMPQRSPQTVAYGQTQTPLLFVHQSQEKTGNQAAVMAGYPYSLSTCLEGGAPSATAPEGGAPSTPVPDRDSSAMDGKVGQTTLFSPLAEGVQDHTDYYSPVSNAVPSVREVKPSSVLQKPLMDGQLVAQTGVTQSSAPAPHHVSFQPPPTPPSAHSLERTATQIPTNLPMSESTPPTALPQTRSPLAPSVRDEKDTGELDGGVQPGLVQHHHPPQVTRPFSSGGEVGLSARKSGVKLTEGVLHLSRVTTPDLALPPETAIDSSTPKPIHSRLVGGVGGVPPTSPVPYVSGTHGLSDTPHRRGVILRKTLSAAMSEEEEGGGSTQQQEEQPAPHPGSRAPHPGSRDPHPVSRDPRPSSPAPHPGSPDPTHGAGYPGQEPPRTPPHREVPDPSQLPRLDCLGCVSDRQVVRAVAFDPQGHLVAVGANSQCLRICSAETLLSRPPGESTSELPVLHSHASYHQGSIYCLTWSNAHLLASGSNDQTVRLMRFDPQDGLPASAPCDLHIHHSTVRDVAFLNDNILVSAGSGDCVVKLVECQTQSPLLDLRGHVEQILALAVHSGQTVISAGQDKLVKCWDVASRSAVGTICLTSPVASLAVKDTTLAAVCLDGSLSIYDLRMLDSTRPLSSARLHDHECRSVRFSPDGRLLLTGSYDRSVRATILSSMQSKVVATHMDKVIQCRWHPSGQVCASTGSDKKACFWRVTQ